MKECICKKLRECDEQHKAGVVLQKGYDFIDPYDAEWTAQDDEMWINHDEDTLKPYAFIRAGFSHRKGHPNICLAGSIIYIKHCPFCGEKLWSDAK